MIQNRQTICVPQKKKKEEKKNRKEKKGKKGKKKRIKEEEAKKDIRIEKKQRINKLSEGAPK